MRDIVDTVFSALALSVAFAGIFMWGTIFQALSQ